MENRTDDQLMELVTTGALSSQKGAFLEVALRIMHALETLATVEITQTSDTI